MSKSIDEVIKFSHFLKRARQENHNQDRLSDLPESVLLHILSFLNCKHAVQTSFLSTRWKNLWKYIPALILHSVGFPTVKKFAIFVSKILTLRDTSTALRSLSLFRCGVIEPQLLKKILNYVSSHNTHLQDLSICVVGDSSLIMRCVSSCRTLTSLNLHLDTKSRNNYTETLFPKSLNLPLLTSLDLSRFTFCGGENSCAQPFSAFTKLNSLVLRYCKVKDAQIFSISSDTLVNLTIQGSFDLPQIKLSTPSVCTFTFNGTPYQKICGSGLSSVKQANINVETSEAASVEYALVLLSWLQDLACVESLTVTSTTLKMLSLVPDLLEVKFPTLCNLKSLEVSSFFLKSLEVKGIPLFDESLNKAAAKSLFDGIDFLRQNSPSAKVNITEKMPYCRNPFIVFVQRVGIKSNS